MNLLNNLGIDGSYIIIGLLCAVLVLFVLYIVLLKKLKEYKKNYDTFMKGSNGETLEAAILSKFNEIDDIYELAKHNESDISSIIDNMKYTYQKFSIYKYDAFKEMGGKLSFSLCMLTDNDDGFIITSVHSSNEGCYIYIKEIIKGESYVLLSEDEKKVLQQAKMRKSCLDD